MSKHRPNPLPNLYREERLVDLHDYAGKRHLSRPSWGFVRFVGGPRHNEHICLSEWLEFFEMYERGAPVRFDDLTTSVIKTVTYKLTRMVTDSQTYFWEYHLT